MPDRERKLLEIMKADNGLRKRPAQISMALPPPNPKGLGRPVSAYLKRIVELYESCYTVKEIAYHLGLEREKVAGVIKRNKRKHKLGLET